MIRVMSGLPVLFLDCLGAISWTALAYGNKSVLTLRLVMVLCSGTSTMLSGTYVVGNRGRVALPGLASRSLRSRVYRAALLLSSSLHP